MDSQPEERGDQPCGRCGFEDLHQAAGVVAVRVRQVDPAQVGRLDPGHSVSRNSGCDVGQARVDEHRLLGVHHVRVDWQEAEAGDRVHVGEGDDVRGRLWMCMADS